LAVKICLDLGDRPNVDEMSEYLAAHPIAYRAVQVL
jgi:hypothetical protein